MAHKVFVYGTLRPRPGEDVNKLGIDATGYQVYVQGYLYNLGWFPGIKLHPEGQSVLCDVLEVTDEQLKDLDSYEGYYPEYPEDSLFVRIAVNVAGMDGFIYEYNGNPKLDQVILSGDWYERDQKCYA